LVELLEKDKTVDGGLQTIEQELRELEERARINAEGAASRTAVLRREMESVRDERERVAGLLSVQMRRRYEQLFERRGGVAVVEMRGGNCLGCKMSLPPQLGNEVRKGTSVLTCPSCHRILYWRPESSDAAAEEA
jgi:predicted  nucleic acid-binding Zn-ribbon protein